MNIQEIFKGVEYDVKNVVEKDNFNNMSYNSREIKEGDIFVALIGNVVDGHDYIKSAIDNGAKMIIAEREDFDYPNNITLVLVKNLRDNLGQIASNFYNWPQKNLKIIGVTGTNGKTTSTYILESIFKNSARVGTTGYRILDKEYEAKNTTPESLDLIKLMKEALDKGVTHFIMEVSSHALCQGRVKMLEFDSAIFTNLTQDHLDFHETLEKYFEAKASILNHMKKDARLIINKDDKYCRRLLNVSDSFSLKENANIKGEVLEYTLKGMKVKITKDEKEYIFVTKLMGEYNLQNLLGAILSAYNLGIDLDEIISDVQKISSIAGRFEIIDNEKDVMVVVDYAHTADGLINILKTLSVMKKNRLVTLFGAGGDRDKTKRPKMANAACMYSDYVYLTSDNPRTEDPELILNDVEKGMVEGIPYTRICDRENAIKNAIQNLQKNDILLIAGKGHEDYQIIGREKIHFDDREMARKYLGGR
ncbi:UDP-N-acetylmuramoyl-L-alanyl-D-glutamate--2, 6-diaminopimelate ligase [Streptobacillus felis]|uniref:UDP-N-acetylmuramoyl-L-alanyl-D-glutamate--2,6-diaminopimelate ligase n=1 Tax=Streptobacillus felis TaxID=1384509 RepID=A0A7Z0T876_9FUSO|nr:UDP-N-acetylmuramoyl-L-alanyl-D-glutamate--2,6-diaminopimelate ligase [Streptobacillus felis]NYV27649.1 UDP-N-acetylmuramoyl-L-alanyl-D-glutamate--2,6-diaminopimelate ligase [Streptobacillus felis]